MTDDTRKKRETTVDRAAGKAQEPLGEALYDRELTARGVVNRADGQNRQAIVDLKDDIEGLKERALDLLDDAARALHRKIDKES